MSKSEYLELAREAYRHGDLNDYWKRRLTEEAVRLGIERSDKIALLKQANLEMSERRNSGDHQVAVPSANPESHLHYMEALTQRLKAIKGLSSANQLLEYERNWLTNEEYLLKRYVSYLAYYSKVPEEFWRDDRKTFKSMPENEFELMVQSTISKARSLLESIGVEFPAVIPSDKFTLEDAEDSALWLSHRFYQQSIAPELLYSRIADLHAGATFAQLAQACSYLGVCCCHATLSADRVKQTIEAIPTNVAMLILEHGVRGCFHESISVRADALDLVQSMVFWRFPQYVEFAIELFSSQADCPPTIIDSDTYKENLYFAEIAHIAVLERRKMILGQGQLNKATVPFLLACLEREWLTGRINAMEALALLRRPEAIRGTEELAIMIGGFKREDNQKAAAHALGSVFRFVADSSALEDPRFEDCINALAYTLSTAKGTALEQAELAWYWAGSPMDADPFWLCSDEDILRGRLGERDWDLTNPEELLAYVTLVAKK